MRFRFVTFDINGTLLKPKRSIGEIYGETAASFGIKSDPKVLTNNFKTTYQKMCVSHPNFGKNSGLDWKTWWKKVVLTTFEKSLANETFREKSNDLNRLSEHLIKSFETKTHWELIDGGKELLDDLNRFNVAVGVISNSDSRLANILKELKLHRKFAFIITSYEVNVSKPDPEIFKYAVERFEKLKGEKFDSSKTLHVGNSLELDYNPAKSIGWSAALIEKDKDKLLNLSNNDKKLIFKDLGELHNFIINS